jgi:hypothetical protein
MAALMPQQVGRITAASYVTGSRVAGRRTARDCAGVPRPGRELTDHAVSASSLGFRPGSVMRRPVSLACVRLTNRVWDLPYPEVRFKSCHPDRSQFQRAKWLTFQSAELCSQTPYRPPRECHLWWVVLVDRAQGIISHPTGGSGRGAGLKATNGRVRTKSLTAVSERRSSSPRLCVRRRNRPGCRRRKSTATANLSAAERKRCSGANDSRPI